MGISIRKWSQQERIDNTEYCGRCSNAKREGENRDASESWGFAQHAQAEAQILNEILNPIYAARVATFLFGLLNTAQIDSRAAVRLLLRHPLRHVFLGFRSEERRVGKECRSRWGPEHYKKKRKNKCDGCSIGKQYCRQITDMVTRSTYY